MSNDPTAAPPRDIPLARPSVGEREWRALREVLESGWLTQGPAGERFEALFAERHRVRHAIAVSSGTAALHVALAAAGLGPGDEVIVPSFTWVASANAVLLCGATPVLCDVDPQTYNIDPQDMRARLTGRTKAVMPVDLFGLPADMEALKRGLPESVLIIEDAACAVGARYQGRPVGSQSLAAAYSFHPRKIITTGEGGMITTDDDAVAAEARALRNHGARPGQGPAGPAAMPDFYRLGCNYRLSDVLARIGEVQMERLDELLAGRRRAVARYLEGLSDIPWLGLPVEPDGMRHSWQSFVVRLDPRTAPLPRDAVMQKLQDRGIMTRIGTHAVHMLSFYRERFGYRPDDLPHARECMERTIALPLSEGLTPDDLEYVITALKEC